MRISAAVISVIVFSLYCHAQDEPQPIKTKSQFSVAMLNGIGQSRYVETLGNHGGLDRLNSAHLLNFKYRYRFSDKFFAEAGWGFGAQIENFAPRMMPFEGLDLWHFNAFFQARIEFSGAYQIYQHRNNRLYAKLGAGWNRFNSYQLISGSSSFSTSYGLNVEIPGQRLPFVSLGLDYAIPTKRKDEFSLYLGYHYGFNSYYRASYQYFDNGVLVNEGTLSSHLRAVQFGVGYTFTRLKRKERLAERLQESDGNLKLAKKQVRFEKRAIDPKSRYLNVGLGWGLNQSRFTPNRAPLFGAGGASFLYRLTYEHGWKNNLFFEADVYGFQFWSSEFLKFPGFRTGSLSSVFFANFLSVGTVYKIQNKKTNFQFFNVHGGLGLGFHFSEKGTDGYGQVSMISNDYSYSYAFTSEVRGHLMPVIYGGISKDIRVTERFFVNIGYRHQLGFNSVYASDYVFQDENMSAPKILKSKIDGTAYMFHLGFKYRLK